MTTAAHPEQEQSCACDRCTCTDPADLTLGRVPLCGCCAADCPDTHGAAAEERRAQFWREQIRAKQRADDESTPSTPSTPGIWRYVVSRTPNSSELNGEGFEIRELYPAEDGPEFSYTSDPVTPAGATVDELREELLHMLAALDQPILDLTADPPQLHP